jgi:hypothetical protein
VATTTVGSAAEVRAWVGVDAPMDLTALSAVSVELLPGLPVSRAVAALLSCGIDRVTRMAACPVARMAAFSPIRRLDAADPPGYLVGGIADSIVPVGQQAVRMEREAGRVSADVAIDLVDTGDPTAWTHNQTQWGMNHSALRGWLDHVTS